MTGLIDQAERERIRTSLDETLVVEAAAGTGKTTELVKRLINVLAEGRGTVQSVAALTFTEKAAGELKLRLRAGLEAERSGAPPSSLQRANLEDAIAHLEEARISTIHGFCNDLLRERPVEAQVDPQFDVLGEAEGEALYKDAFDEWIQAVLEDPPEGVRRALCRPSTLDSDGGAVDRLRIAGWDLANWRDLRAPWRLVPFDRNTMIDTLVPLLHTLADRSGTCSNPNDRLYRDTWLARRLSADIRLSERVRTRDYDRLEGGLVELAGSRDFRGPRQGFDRNYGRGVTRSQILEDHRQLLAALDDFARQADADLAARLQQELFATIDRYEVLKAQVGALDFVDLLLRMRDLIHYHRHVREALQSRFTHIFVDEFHDTDPLQAEIILLLAASDPTVDRWRDAVPTGGKLFIVGDPKQSIYRFRRADVGMYQEVKALLCERGASLIRLTTSFRAVPSIQRLVNAAFAPVMVEDRATLQADYVGLAPYRPELSEQPSVVALAVPQPYGQTRLTKTAIEQSLPDSVGAFVHWLLEESGWKITKRDQPGEVLSIEARHICLLFRRFSSWGRDVTQAYVDALEARSIPHMLVGGKSFHLREEVESLRTALSAIEWPDDELSVYGTLKGPLFAIGDEELLEWRQRWGRLHPYRGPVLGRSEPIPDHLGAVTTALSMLRGLHSRRNYRPVEETVNDLLKATRAHAGFMLRPRGEQALANALRIGELARAFEASGGISFRSFVERLREEAETTAPEAPIIEEGSDGIRIMTVHKAKGLEFPIVILADIMANIARGHAARYINLEQGLCALRLGGWSPWDLLEHEAEEVARERAEGVRVAYVAATRARDLLVVPTLGDDPFAMGWNAANDGWVAPVQRAVYPTPEKRRTSVDAPGCPSFGNDSVLERLDHSPLGPNNVRPGLHAFEPSPGERYAVVWWDPRRLTLNAKPIFGLRREDLIVEPDRETVEIDRRRYDDWQRERQGAREQGEQPSISVQTVSDWARQKVRNQEGQVTPEVILVDAAPPIVRPTGLRFGRLVHSVLASVPLDATSDQIDDVTELQCRILGATSEEATAAKVIIEAVLGHPFMLRAREAWQTGKCRRETPIAWLESDGTLVEGVVDLVFQDVNGWTIVDFKTDAEVEIALEHYRRQVSLYASAVARATGENAGGVLIRL